MDSTTCDLCGCDLLSAEVRYIVKIQVYAAYDVQEITDEDLKRDIEGEMRDLIRRIQRKDLGKDEVHETVYKDLTFDLCSDCQRRFLDSPLGKAAETLKREREVKTKGEGS
jgi:hypothetical protein